MMLEFEVSVREPYMGNQVPLRVILIYYHGKGWTLQVINPENIIHSGRLVAMTSSGSTIDPGGTDD